MARLLPQTHQWASLEAVREAAIRTDAKARAQMPDPDKLRTLFFLGFDLDEQLAERLAHHKRSGEAPEKTLPLPVALDAVFSADAIVDALSTATLKSDHNVVPGGRQMKGTIPEEPALLVRQLAAALVPFAEKYPMPFHGVK